MKKIMILMLSLAVLFSFAACDNSSTTPDTPDEDQTGVTSGAALSAVESPTVKAELAKINTQFGASAKIWDTDKLATGYSVDLAGNSLTWTKTDAEAVVDLEKTYTTITVSGTDITPVADKDSKKVILLERYELEFCQPVDSAALTEGFVSGTISGDMIGQVTITLGADGKVSNVAVAVAPATVMTGLTGKIPTAVLAFLPASAEDVELTYAGAEVDSEKFVDYINSARVNTSLANGYAVADTLTSYNSYKTYWDTQYKSDIYTKLSAALLEEDTGMVDFIDFEKPGLTSTYTYGQSESSATITFTNGTEDDVQFAAADGGLIYSVPVGETVTISLSGKTQTTSTFQADAYTLEGTFNVYSAANTANADYKTVDVNLEGTVTAGADSLVTKADEGNTVKSLAASFTFAVSTALDLDSVAVSTTVEAKVLPGASTANNVTTLTALGPVTVNAAV